MNSEVKHITKSCIK